MLDLRNLTKEKTIQEHRKMWNWIANEIEKRNEIVTKNDYFNEVYPNEVPPLAKCFLCQYAANYFDDTCVYCLLKWPEYHCESELSPYKRYCKAKEKNDIEKAYNAAREIANLPEREDQKWRIGIEI